MSRSDWLALALSVIAFAVALFVSERVYEQMPHLEDEFAYVWQAQVIAEGQLTIDSPPHPVRFLVPFVIDHEGQRFGKYPLGWPALLSVGIRLGVRAWVNPFLTAMGVWLTYRLGKKLMGEVVGLLAALLTITSPFVLMNAGSLMSHPAGLFLSAAFALTWWDAFGGKAARGGWLPAVTAGLVLGALALTRPFTGLGVAFPFGLHGLYLLWRGPRETRRRVLALGGIAALLSTLHFIWQYAVTGDPWLNPYTLWWPYDKVGFGPGVGVTEAGHNLRIAWINTRFSLRVESGDLFGWLRYSWVFLPVGLWAARKNGKLLLTGSVFLSLVVIYMGYWIGSGLYGMRYQFEGVYSLTLLTAAGAAWLGGWPLAPGARYRARRGWRMARPLGVAALLALLFCANIFFYLPPRLGMMSDLYGIHRSRMAPFQTEAAQALTPAVVIVHTNHWTDYGTLLPLEDPFLTTPFIFAFGDRADFDTTLPEYFPERAIYHYYQDEPFKFYVGRRE